MARVAVLLTCHNRREKSIACLTALCACQLPAGTSLQVILVDDGSTDDTGVAVRQQFPTVTILQGDGSLFWNGGMHKAFGVALAEGFDHYLWLNDDTILFADALERLLASANEVEGRTGRASVVVGSTCDPESGKTTYGGKVRLKGWLPHYQVVTEPDTKPKPCETMNGNCVLIPAAVARACGNIDPVFIHAMGDGDYGYRARRAGFGLWVMAGYAGSCAKNRIGRDCLDERANVCKNLQRTMSKKAVPPYAWAVYTRRHYGLLWPLLWVQPYVMSIARSLAAKAQRAIRLPRDTNG